jgi:hypothetical protein
MHSTHTYSPNGQKFANANSKFSTELETTITTWNSDFFFKDKQQRIGVITLAVVIDTDHQEKVRIVVYKGEWKNIHGDQIIQIEASW